MKKNDLHVLKHFFTCLSVNATRSYQIFFLIAVEVELDLLAFDFRVFASMFTTEMNLHQRLQTGDSQDLFI